MGRRENLAARSLTADPWEGHGSPCPSPGLCPGGPTERPAFLIHRPVGETQGTSPEAGGDVVLSSHAPPQSSLAEVVTPLVLVRASYLSGDCIQRRPWR